MTWPASDYGSTPLTEESVHVWTIALDQGKESIGNSVTVLDDLERKRAESMATPKLRARFICAHASLRKVLAIYAKTSSRELQFMTGTHGKPELAPPHMNFRFNLSHSGELAAVAVSAHHEVGVDVESHRTRRGFDTIVASLHPGERRDLTETGKANDPRAILQCWTRKEAYLKALGTGLQVEPHTFQVSAHPDHPPRVLQPCAIDTAESWSMHDLNCGADYSGAVVAEGSVTSVVMFSKPAD